MMYEKLLARILRRAESMLADDMADRRFHIRDHVCGSRVLVIGAAGSIGSAFVRQLLPFLPAGLHLVDISENNLVEVVRDLRSSQVKLPDDFKTFALAIGTREFDRMIESERDYDYVVNFSVRPTSSVTTAVATTGPMIDELVILLAMDLVLLAGRR